jgi:hypothetical protein
VHLPRADVPWGERWRIDLRPRAVLLPDSRPLTEVPGPVLRLRRGADEHGHRVRGGADGVRREDGGRWLEQGGRRERTCRCWGPKPCRRVRLGLE